MASLRHGTLPALLCAAGLSACGGNPSGTAPPAVVVLPPPAPALMASASALALAASGQPRRVLITNVGGQAALDLAVSAASALPAGSALGTDCAARLSPGASCTLTITPGATPSAAPGDTTPTPAELRIGGSNTPALALSVWVLGFGSVYQGGYVFDLDDTTPPTGGVGGQVMALSNAWPTAVQAMDSPLASSPTEGAANTAALVNTGGPPTDPNSPYAAWACDNASDAGFTDWYLPAICELGYDRDNRGSGCGSAAAPTRPNIQSRLVDAGVSGGLSPLFEYWSSTGAGGGITWTQYVGPGPTAAQHAIPSAALSLVRCVRALTP
ncbi:hypothetical protein SOM08_07280 [Hydrogenophaga sp. SNF1]|uniref:hypothetical protein n=1 Tax=Hydrogenophaga sp. SNF1 TaxID=3098762 RepID=UPI002ACC093F|nr:hypothetical protein [Hydrogenophaga sp. SNF1]WQB85112.1 hypothetical protein SOM08_07280 [Hydrogenophaga sp. SNF1]